MSTATIKHNPAKDGIEISFPDIPNIAIRDILKAAGYRWHKYNKYWYAKISSRSLAAAEKYGSLPSTLAPEAIEEENERQSVMSYINAQEEAAYGGNYAWGG